MRREGIETVYAGTKFRSRLEAHWAAFFDLGKRQWEYEPFDLDGYIPDFLLYGRRRNAMIEVKPASLVDLNHAKMQTAATWCAQNDCRLIVLNESLMKRVEPGKWFGRDTNEFYDDEPIGISEDYFKDRDWMKPTIQCGHILPYRSIDAGYWVEAVLAERETPGVRYIDFGIEDDYEEALDDEWPSFAMSRDDYWFDKWAEARNITRWGK